MLYLDFDLGFRAWVGVWVWWWLIWVDWWLGKDLVSLIGSDELSNVDDVSFDARWMFRMLFGSCGLDGE